MFLAEREDQLALLARRFAACRAGRGSVTLVLGGVGTGKSALLGAFRAQVAARALVVEAMGEEGAPPFGVVAQLAQAAPTAAARRTAASLRRARGGRSGEAAAEDAALRLLAELASAAGGKPLVVLVDDLHAVDDASTRWLLSLPRRGPERTMLVVTDREAPAPDNALRHTDLLRGPSFRRLTLGPLSPHAVALVVKDLTGGCDDATAAFCHATSGGNPLLLHALVHDLTGAGDAPGELSARAVLASLRRAPEPVRAVAEVVALLGESASTSRVDALSGGTGRAGDHLGLLSRWGLLDGLAFRHEAGRAAVLDDLAERGDRAAWHTRIAELLHHEGEPDEVVAEHLVAAGTATADWHTRLLHRAARADGAGTRGTRYLDLAFHAGAGGRDATAIRLVRHGWRHEPDRVAGPLSLLATLPRPGAELIPVRAADLYLRGAPREAVAALGPVPPQGIECGDPDTATAVAAARLWLATAVPAPLGPRPDRQRTEPDAASPAAAHTLRAATALYDVLHGSGEDGEDGEDGGYGGDGEDGAVARAQTVLRAAPAGECGAAAGALAVVALTHAGLLPAAASGCEHRLAALPPTSGWCGMFHALRADIAAGLGDVATAARSVAEARRLLPVSRWPVVTAHLRAVCWRIATGGAADEEPEPELPSALFRTRHGVSYLHARGHHHLARDRPQAALTDFLHAGDLVRLWGFDRPSMPAWRVGAAQAWLALGEPERATGLLHEQLDGIRAAGVGESRVRGAALRVLARTVERRHRVPLLREAAEAVRRGGDRLELARVLAALRFEYGRQGDTAAAELVTVGEWQLADERGEAGYDPDGPCGAGPPRRRGRGLPPRALTEAEGRVAALAARGSTNRDIASRLHVTTSTVEQHLTKVYRKLGVRHRRELADRMTQVV
ncbi:helix-turn-helix transcriptional regulator [Saccharomonospora piscinae]|uniref:helix-turn-helix transcriptional regulator n=1 Tax=Saccharomonospora piscinae TaxID=687388 RepID=UPI0004633B89|nr:LuxR family transcriptional regulator [Saccharomonospora piscinae]